MENETGEVGNPMVLVYAPVGSAEVSSFDGCFSVTKEYVTRAEVVGMLPPRDITPQSLNRLRAEVEPHGATADIVVLPVRDRPSYIGYLVGYRVCALTTKAALELPGFIPLYEWSGECYDLLGLNREKDHEVRLSHDISEYRMPAGTVHPDYAKDNAAVLSAIPLGQLGRYVFLEEAPDRWFFVHPTIPEGDTDDAAVAKVREFRSSP
jgi:hypothetical protein